MATVKTQSRGPSQQYDARRFHPPMKTGPSLMCPELTGSSIRSVTDKHGHPHFTFDPPAAGFMSASDCSTFFAKVPTYVTG